MKYLIILLFAATLASAGIIGPVPTSSPSPLPSPVAEVRTAAQIHVIGHQIYTVMSHADAQLTTLFWNNPNGLTAQQVFGSIDTAPGGYAGEQCDAQAKMLALKAFLNNAVAGSASAQPHSVTTSGTGTSCVVTVGQ